MAKITKTETLPLGFVRDVWPDGRATWSMDRGRGPDRMSQVVEVSAPFEIQAGNYSETRPAGVNWSAIGTSTPDQARAFAEALVDAASYADRLNEGGQ